MFGVTLNYDTRVFLGGQELSGIESASFQYSHPVEVTKCLGMTSGIIIPNGSVQASFNIGRYLLYDDPVFDYTGTGFTSGSFHYGDELFGFEQAYLTDYSINCAVGSVPQVNAGFGVFGDFTVDTISASGNVAHPTVDVPTQGSITITSPNASSNRVVGFDFSCRVKRIPHYAFDASSPETTSAVGVDTVYPIEYNAQVQIEVDDANLKPLFYISNDINESVSLSVQGRNGTSLGTYSVPNARLVGEQLSQSANGALIADLTFVGFTNE